jgi:hypothetical protein
VRTLANGVLSVDAVEVAATAHSRSCEPGAAPVRVAKESDWV